MAVDFHTHIYPDRYADRFLASMSAASGLTPARGGTRADLLASMEEAGVSVSVVLPVAARPDQAHGINEKNALLNGRDSLVFFGAIHPCCEDPETELDLIAQAGFRGIKLHPDYQETDFDDPRYLRILEGAARRNLLIVTHAGIDPGYPGCPVRCTPEHILHVYDRLGDLLAGRLILAHLGGMNLPEQVLSSLAGLPFWLDTAFVLDRYPELCLQIIRVHGAHRVLFATDYPWASQTDTLASLHSLGLTQEEEELILRKNAASLLQFSSASPKTT